jgi:biopolymer transport protein ExbD
MNWRIRHEGSPRSIDGLTPQQVVEGLQDGLWEPTDEVMGPQDRQWQAIEAHPQFAEIAAEIEPLPPKVHEDETRLDMNPLIDVALVLLIFFILTTSYAALQKVLEMPHASAMGPIPELRVVKDREVKETMIKVEARMVNGKPVIKVEDEVVDVADLLPALGKYVRQTTKTHLLLDAQDVDWGTVVAIQDAARGVDMQKVYFPVKKPPAK